MQNIFHYCINFLVEIFQWNIFLEVTESEIQEPSIESVPTIEITPAVEIKVELVEESVGTSAESSSTSK